MRVESLIEALAIVVIEVWLFTISTTALAVRRWRRERLPPLGLRLATAFGRPAYRLSLIGELFWLAVAFLLLIGVVTDGIRLNRAHEVLAGVVALILDAVWLAYLAGRIPWRREGHPE